MKRSHDEISAAGIPVPQVPSLVQMFILEPVESSVQESVLSTLKELGIVSRWPFQLPAFLSRHHRSALSQLRFYASPILDAERFLLALLPSGPAIGTFALSEGGEVFSVVDSVVLNGFCVQTEGPAVFDGQFVMDQKKRSYSFVLSDTLVCNKALCYREQGLQERRFWLQQFSEYVRNKCEGIVPFTVMEIKYEPLPQLQKLLSVIFWHNETESRVLIEADVHFPVLGIRLSPVNVLYTLGQTNDSVLDWYYARQYPFYMQCVVVPSNQQVLFSWKDGPAGAVLMRPPHLAAIGEMLTKEGGKCIAKLVHDPGVGLFNVRGVYSITSRPPTSTPLAVKALFQAAEAITKEDLVAMSSQALKQ